MPETQEEKDALAWADREFAKKDAASQIERAMMSVARAVNNDSSAVLRSLREAGHTDIAEELSDALDSWKRATEAFLALVR